SRRSRNQTGAARFGEPQHLGGRQAMHFSETRWRATLLRLIERRSDASQKSPRLATLSADTDRRTGINLAGRVFNLLVVLANLWGGHLAAAPGHSQPHLMSPPEKERLVERLR